MLGRMYLANITVTDMDRSVAFYQALGFRKISDHIHDNPQIGRMWGIEGFGSLRLVWMRSGHDEPLLDLVQFIDPPTREAPRPAVDRVGLQRLVFRCDDIESLGRRLTEMGAEFVCPPQEIVGHQGKTLTALYFRDPDGTLLEAVSYPE